MNRPFNFLKNAISGGNRSTQTKLLTATNTLNNNADTEADDKPSTPINWITEIVTVLLIVFGIALTLVMLPVIPFLWVSYKGFHGKYGIIKLIRENYNIYQL